MQLEKKVFDCSFVDWPESRTLADYDDVRQAYINSIKAPIRSVFQIGSVGVPGVSDIDLFVVLDDDVKASFSDFAVSNLTNQQRYIMMHEAWIINKTLLHRMDRIFPYFDLVHVQGPASDASIPRQGAISPECAFCFLMEYSLTKIPRSLIDLLHRKIVPARTALVLINSVRHSIELCRISGGLIKPEWDEFLEGFEAFRRSVPKGTDENQNALKKYFCRAILLGFELLSEVAETVVRRSGRDNVELHRARLEGFFSATFSADWTVDESLDSALNKYRYAGNWLLLPSELLHYWTWGASHPSVLGEFIDKRLPVRIKSSFPEPSYVNDHFDAVCEYISFSRNMLRYRGSIWVTLGAGESRLFETARFAKAVLMRARWQFGKWH